MPARRKNHMAINTDPGNKVPAPRCPHCGSLLESLGLYSWFNLAGMIFCAYCPNEGCHKMLTMQILPSMGTDEPGGRIQIPS
jgi:hypothetical protein